MKKLFCDHWQFAKSGTDVDISALGTLNFAPVDIPHDWLIYNTRKLYETSFGWYKRTFTVGEEQHKSYRLYFEGVYMDCTVYINGTAAFDWKYGYTSFEADITDYVKPGDNEVVVLVRHFAPNSRWYSGAGIYRNVWFIETEKTFLETDGVYFSANKQNGAWHCAISADVSGGDYDDVLYTITDKDGAVIHKGNETAFILDIPAEKIWDIENPYLFHLKTELMRKGAVIDSQCCNIGFREICFDSDKGFFLNGRNIKINGVCLHHDLGCLGAAFNKEAMRRQITIMREMGVNAIRTAHNPPAKAFMELCDEMSILVNNEFTDMWERPMTKYDYARFFIEWYEKDVASWIRRDRNHPCLIMWSIGNEIYDTHVSERGLEVTKMLQTAVRQHDPRCNAFTTIGSNYMQWDNGQACAEAVDLAGYNYGEHLYTDHHQKYPHWKIYGSENTVGVKSRGIYHFPRARAFLTHEDLQCSNLGNCKSGFDRLTAEDVIVVNRDTDFCAGMFVWTGFDYIGEPTPYSTKNSYFGIVDTAGIKKDIFWLYKAAWTDEPVLHIMPYWDFNEGQEIDIVVYTNLKTVELFKNGISLGKQQAENYTLAWKTEYEKGAITAVAFDENGRKVQAERKSFGDSHEIVLVADKTEIQADGQDLFTVEISTVDANGLPVENARDRVNITVAGARLVGFDNGDSTDYDPYKGNSRRLFSGKAMAYIAAPVTPGPITVTAESPGLQPAQITLAAIEAAVQNGLSHLENIQGPTVDDEIPVRKIELLKTCGSHITPENGTIPIQAKLLPENAAFRDVVWSVVTSSGIKTNIAEIQPDGLSALLTVVGDGDFRLRCVCNNGKKHADVISEYEFYTSGFGATSTNPYQFTPACLNNAKTAEFLDTSEGGILIKEESNLVGFNNVDFGKYGSDKLEFSAIYWFRDVPFGFKLWLNDPRTAEGELLGAFEYQADFKWQTYQVNTYKLNKTLCGTQSIFFEFGAHDSHLHFGGFAFIPKQKAYQSISAVYADMLHGDNFTVENNRVLGIGNNVFIEYQNMDFTDGTAEMTVKGRTRHAKDSVHVHFEMDSGETIRELFEFPYSDDYIEVTNPIANITGKGTVRFCFLPGCDFDLESFIIKPKGMVK